MKHISLIILLHSKQLMLATVCCALFFVTTAQQTVANKTFFQDRPTMLFSGVIADADTFIVLGVVTGVPNNTAKGIVGKVDSQIQFSHYKPIGDSINADYGLFWNTLLMNTQSEIVFTGYCNDSLASILVGLYSLALDSIYTNRIFYPNQTGGFQAYGIVESIDGGYYIVGGRSNKVTANTDAFLLKVNSNLQQEWIKFYNQLIFDYAKSVTVLQNGNLLVGAFRNNNNQTPQKSNTWLLEVDTGGQFVRQWFDPNDSTYVAEGLRQTQDGGFIYGAQKKNYQSGFSSVSYNATIVKMDSNFNKQWTFIRGGNDLSIYTGITDIEELPDGSFVAAGHLTYYGTDTALNGYVVKLDVDGNVIWERNYRGINESQTLNFLSDIDILPGGGLIAVGQCQKSGATPPQVGWFLKLDSNGCEVENCILSSPLTPEGGIKNKIQVWPNPASGRVQIHIENEMLSGEIKIYDVAGSLLLQNKMEATEMSVDVSSFAPGMYVVVAEKQGKVARSKLVVE
ncbi:MAG: T9SS type A sorting domain-containing protein [Chitinophagales bacterium]|nr:T9SS type A sorting domain-containing protein [Chitinophagales bacterium]